jgi:hypothetical protein
MDLDARDYAKAALLFEQARTIDHRNSHIASQLAQVYFRHGELEKAWQMHEARFGLIANDPFATAQRRPYPQPLWQGETLNADQALLLYGEQGMGEEILHTSMLHEAMARAKNIVVECAPRLMPLFARSFPGIRFVPRGDAPVSGTAIAHQAPLGHLGALFRKSFDAFPNQPSYLKADAAKTALLRAKYDTLAQGKKIIGISWKSKKLRHGDPKSTSLQDWKPIFDTGAFFVSLQYGETETDRAEAGHVHRDATVDQMTSLDDFAAQVAAMDAVISVSNTAAHMAGALGIKAAILLPASRGLMGHWFDNGDKSPWYPSVTLLRQKHDGDWGDVMPRAAGFIR